MVANKQRASQSSFPQSPRWRMCGRRARQPSCIRPAAHLCDAKQRWGRRGARFKELGRRHEFRGKNEKRRAVGQWQSRGGGWVNPEKTTLPAARGYSSAVGGEHLVSLDRVLATPGQDTDKPGRFLLPVKGRLQGKRQGCWGRIRPRAGSVKARQPPVTHAQSLQAPIIPQGCDLPGTTACVCLGTGSGFSFSTLVFTLNYYRQKLS